MSLEQNPIQVGGTDYPDWRREDGAYVITDIPQSTTADFMLSLGQHLPGKTEDGSDILWSVSAVGFDDAHGVSGRVVLIPEEWRTRIGVSFGMAEGHIMSKEAARGLVGQWFTLLIFGSAVLARVVEVEREDDGKRINLTAETDWSGATTRPEDG